MTDSPKKPLCPMARQAKSKTARKKDGILVNQHSDKIVIEIRPDAYGGTVMAALMPGDLLAVVDEVLSYYDQ